MRSLEPSRDRKYFRTHQHIHFRFGCYYTGAQKFQFLLYITVSTLKLFVALFLSPFSLQV